MEINNIISRVANGITGVYYSDSIVLQDDTYDIIIEKICASQNNPEYTDLPNLLRLATKDNIKITRENVDNMDLSEICVFNIVEELFSKSYITLDINSIEPEFHFKLTGDYPDLKENDLYFVIEVLKMLSELPYDENSVNMYAQNGDAILNSLNIKYFSKGLYSKFLGVLSQTSEIPIESIVFTSISYIYDPHSSIQDFESPVRLFRLFNSVETTPKIPLIVIDKNYTPENKTLIKMMSSGEPSSKKLSKWVLTDQGSGLKNFKTINFIIKLPQIDNLIDLWITLNISESGLLKVNIKLPSNKLNVLSSDKIKKVVQATVSDFVSSINEKIGVLSGNFKFPQIVLNETLVNCTVTTKGWYIDRAYLENILLDKRISDNVFSLKKSESENVLSITGLRKEIIHVADNLNEPSAKTSIITISNNVNPTHAIYTVYKLYACSYINKPKVKFDENAGDRPLLLKDIGFNVSSKKCQKKRQPSIVYDDATGKNTIKFDKWKFRCQDPVYPYPGFHPDNIPCCFKNSQISTDTYIRNMNPDSQGILVKPSNLKVPVITSTGVKYSPFVIRKIEYPDRYFYITELNKLEEITDPESVSFIKGYGEIIFLETVNLSTLLYPPSTNKCGTPPIINPELEVKGINTMVNYNDPSGGCSVYGEEYTLGYGTNSVPCCYKLPRAAIPIRAAKEYDITKQYIVQSVSKLMNYKKIGSLPIFLSKVFNEMTSDGIIYRMGVIQNNDSFLNAIILALDKEVPVSEFKKELVGKLSEPKLFSLLNNGKIRIKYKNIENYKNHIFSDAGSEMIDIIGITENLIKKTILVIDITENPHFVCRSKSVIYDDFIVLLQKSELNPITLEMGVFYELVIKMKKNVLFRTHSISEPFIGFLLEYEKDTCKTESITPIGLEPLPTNAPAGWISVVNQIGKVNYYMNPETRLLQPVKESVSRSGEKVIFFRELVEQKILARAQDYMHQGIIIVAKSNIKGIVGLMTKYGVFVPALGTLDLITTDIIYYTDTDINLEKEDPDNNLDFIKFATEFKNDILDRKYEKEKIIGNLTNVKVDSIQKIINSQATTVEKVLLISKMISNNVNPSDTIKSIAQEIIDDNIDNSLLKGSIYNLKSLDSIITRNSEVIVNSYEDFMNFISE